MAVEAIWEEEVEDTEVDIVQEAVVADTEVDIVREVEATWEAEEVMVVAIRVWAAEEVTAVADTFLAAAVEVIKRRQSLQLIYHWFPQSAITIKLMNLNYKLDGPV